jgi:hypothetical protein
VPTPKLSFCPPTILDRRIIVLECLVDPGQGEIVSFDIRGELDGMFEMFFTLFIFAGAHEASAG